MHSTVQQIMDQAMQELPSCGRPIVATILRDVASDFLARTQILKVELEALDVVALTYLYTLTVPEAYAGYRIDRPVEILLDGRDLRPGIDYRMQDRTTLQLRTTPQAAITDGLEVTASLTVDDIHTADLTAVTDWWGPLAAGAKYRCMMMPNKPWTDQRTGMMYASEYNKGLSDAMSFAATGGLNAPMRLGM